MLSWRAETLASGIFFTSSTTLHSKSKLLKCNPEKLKKITIFESSCEKSSILVLYGSTSVIEKLLQIFAGGWPETRLNAGRCHFQNWFFGFFAKLMTEAECCWWVMSDWRMMLFVLLVSCGWVKKMSPRNSSIFFVASTFIKRATIFCKFTKFWQLCVQEAEKAHITQLYADLEFTLILGP